MQKHEKKTNKKKRKLDEKKNSEKQKVSKKEKNSYYLEDDFPEIFKEKKIVKEKIINLLKESDPDEKERLKNHEDTINKIQRYEQQMKDALSNSRIRKKNDANKDTISENLTTILENIKILLVEVESPKKESARFSAKQRAHNKKPIVKLSNLNDLLKSDGSINSNDEDKRLSEPSMKYNIKKENGKKKPTNMTMKEVTSDILAKKENVDFLNTVRDKINNLLPPKETKKTYTQRATKKHRGSGQISAMAGYNAATYALACGLISHDKKALRFTDWDWLHIQGSALGGATEAYNLLPGTKDANTWMMPFESHINQLTKIATTNHPLEVKFTPEGDSVKNIFDKDVSYEHVRQHIILDWKFPNGIAKSEDKVNHEFDGKVKFDILDNRMPTKPDVKKLEEKLKTKRDELKNPKKNSNDLVTAANNDSNDVKSSD